MKLIIVRHGDPDYEHDDLTAAGIAEARALAARVKNWHPAEIGVSPLGRAMRTFQIAYGLSDPIPPVVTLANGVDVPVRTYDWLQEFSAPIHRPDVPDRMKVAWDWLPADWTKHEAFFDKDKWLTEPPIAESTVPNAYREVCENLDVLLKKYGYIRDGYVYRVEHESEETVVFFCHFGLECVLLSHLISVPLMPLWHGFCAAPSSVTVVRTEERRQGIASFRISTFGDTSHLYTANVPISAHARFTEVYSDEMQRHD